MQSRMAMGWGLLLLGVVIITVVSAVQMNSDLNRVVGTVVVCLFAVVSLAVGVLAVRRLSRALTSRLRESVSGLSSTMGELMAIASQVTAGSAQIATCTDEASKQSTAGTRQVEQEVRRLQELAVKLQSLTASESEG